MIKNITLSLSVFIFLFLLFESSVRILDLWRIQRWDDYDFYSPSEIDGVPYLLKPSLNGKWVGTHVVSNSLGMREIKELPLQQSGTTILALGDSLTFSHGVDQSHTYPQQLENLLSEMDQENSLPHPIKVYNAGMNGFNAWDSANLLEFLLKKIKPDLVLILIISNDYDESAYFNPQGQLIMDPSYISSEFLRLVWGLDKNYLCPSDFRKVMDKKSLDILDGVNSCSSNSLLDSLSSTFISISYIKNNLKKLYNLVKSDKPVCDDFIPLQPTSPCSIENNTFLNGPNSIYFSPSQKNKFNGAISKVEHLAIENNVPIKLLYSLVPIDYTPKQNQEYFHIEPIEKYLNQGLVKLQKKHNLGWDPHLSTKGNRILAEGIKLAVIDHFSSLKIGDKLSNNISSDISCLKEDNNKFVSSLKNKLYHEIIIDKFSGINQIYGGLYPPLTSSSISRILLAGILRANGEEFIQIHGSFSGADEIELKVKATSEEKSILKSEIINPGYFNITLEANFYSGEVTDIEVVCQNGHDCAQVQILRAGFGSWNGPEIEKLDTLPKDLELNSWGPSTATIGKPFNLQPDGSSAIWVKINGKIDKSSQLVIDNNPLPSAIIEEKIIEADINRISTSISATIHPKILEKYWAKEGSARIWLRQPLKKYESLIGHIHFSES
ncbi:MAG TPA: hypothetical protein PKA63_00980 [Oligoflexia bacterium]|nr:hypothetical protein [Oligoflexia bacterium]HMP47222.1 hypothetical protein [Oligoflexia bacterium]